MIPPAGWPASVRNFERLWRAWKEENDYLDFTDMLEVALRDHAHCPHNPAVLFVDEVQDCPKLQLSLLMKWAEHTEQLVLAGDEDQTIFGWCGATVEAFLNLPVPDNQKIVLGQSYRLPRAVHAYAEKWIKQVKRRQPKKYAPRDTDGQVKRLAANFNNAEELLEAVGPDLEADKRVMFVASCAYMLKPLIAVMRKRGIPFANPYRPKHGGWNPLKLRGGGNVFPAGRVVSFLMPDQETWGQDASMWTGEDVAAWASVLKSAGTGGVLATGAKAWLAQLKGDDAVVEVQELLGHVRAESHSDMAKLTFLSREEVVRSLSWWYEHCLDPHQKKLEYPVRVAKANGGRALLEKPRVVIGTVHSIKGGEAAKNCTTTGRLPHYQ
jgi:hypothetical protein